MDSRKAFLEKRNLLSVVKDVKTALMIDLIGDKIGFRYAGELAGLKELDEINFKLKDLIPKAKEDDFIHELKESNQAKEAGKYNLGFGIIYAQYNNSLTVIPILGKGKKR